MYKTTYDKSECQTGIVHIGYGNFHRAHQAMYIDDYMEKSGDLRWGIVAVNLRNEGFREIDDYILKTPSSCRIVRSHLDYIDWTKNRTIAKHMLTLPSVHLITVTVTESGYAPGSPLFEYLACGLRNRNTPITILCCDNIRQNGKVLEAQFLAYLYQTNQHEMADWVRGNVKFPSCMVDRITPRTTSQLLSRKIGRRPVPHLRGHNPLYKLRNTLKWVIEDNFASEFPDLSQVGATIVHDIGPIRRNENYECSTVVIHLHSRTLVLFPAIRTFDQVMRNKSHLDHFRKLQKEEIIPSIEMELPFDIDEYAEIIEERLSSAANHDELERICMDGFTKFHTFILPSLRVCLNRGKRPIQIYKSIAAWYIYSRKFAKGCKKIRYNEPNWSLLEPLLKEGKFDDFVTSERLWGDIPKTYITFSRDLKTLLMSHTYEKEIDLIGE